MSQVIKLKKGLDIRLEGEPRRELKRLPLVHAYAVRPDDFSALRRNCSCEWMTR